MTDQEANRIIAIAIFFTGMAILLFGIAVGAYQVILWLHDGFWSTVLVRQVATPFLGHPLPDPEMTWAGLQKINVWLLDCPLWSFCIVTGAIIFWIGADAMRKI